MPSLRRAVIDVGTNSVKLLVAEVQDGAVEPIFEDSEQTRLGAGFFETRRLQPAAVSHTAQAVAAFARRAGELGAVSTRVIATSAAREAVNPGDLTCAIENAAGLRVEIISGEQEADWVFQGVTTNPELAGKPMLLLDVGGGSTEFILGQGARKQFRESFPIGTVRLLEKLALADPPSADQLFACRQLVKDFFEHEVRPRLAPALASQALPTKPGAQQLLVGTGGTATILARMESQLSTYDRELIERTRLNVTQIEGHVERLWNLPLVPRQTIAGLPPSRADVILPGVVIYECVMLTFGFLELQISTRGLRFAAVMAAD